ncbi:MAG: superantigen-like protein, partial [Staphylococcus aureus]|nr:superantigen-like protein [Staphylococcus aureus]
MKMTQIAKTSLALSLLTTGVSIVTTQSAKAEVASALKTEQTPKSNIQKATTSPSSKAEATQQTPSVTTTPPPNVQPQSPTTKQAQKEINPKYKD